MKRRWAHCTHPSSTVSLPRLTPLLHDRFYHAGNAAWIHSSLYLFLKSINLTALEKIELNTIILHRIVILYEVEMKIYKIRR